MSFKRKLRKLVRNPKLFWADMLIKKNRKISNLMPKKMEGHNSYTIVSAVYNVSLYLDDFFKSLVDQRLDFTHNIHVVLVDDGSTDNSAEIIKKWQAKYPKNISYFYKENGGQASARNIGLKYVNTKWVTFVDPDDTLDLNFFLEIDKYIKSTKDKKLQMIVANLLMHDEKSGEIKNNHALKYRFEKNNVILPFDNLGKHINLSVSSSLFVTKVLQDHHIVFDKDIRPNFEDGHFIGQYLSSLTEGYVVFLNKAHYFYRKRSDNSSTIDTSWTQLGKYREVVERGYLGLFNIFLSKNELIPVHIQRTVLYDIIWHIKYLINRPERINFLTEEQRVKYLETFYEIFNYIDVKTIMEFELAGSWFLHKVGLLGLFKRSQPTFQIVYIDSYDLRKQQLLIRYFTYEKEFEYFTIGDEDIIPAHVKTMSYDFINQTFVLERRLWINISSDRKDELFNARISNLPTRINFNGKQFLNGISIYTILKHFGVKIGKSTLSIKYNDLWVLMDRDTQADDNAEHLYRYLREYEPQQSIVYVLRQDSADWTRLYDEGFNLVAYGSFEHEASLRACTKIISSHAEQHVVNYFKDNSLKDKQFIFLQHGVTKDDLSSWLNTKSIDCLVTSARAEFDSIIGDNTRYKFSDKEVVLTGFPRHDRLLQNLPEADRIILVMPTWRKNLVGEIVDGNIRSYNSQFMQSEYAQAWQSLLCDKNLQLLLENNNYQLVFYPHPNIQIYLSDFNLPAHIQVIETLNGSIQSLIRKSALLITDYSSVAYEMAYLKRPIIYYQFDDIFQGEHTYQKGYFDYERDGFGPVVHNKVAVLDALESIIKNNQRSKSIYLERMEKFFLFRDGQCCKRVAEAIFALDVPSSSEDVNLALLKQYAELASSVGEVHIAEKRWLRLWNDKKNQLMEASYTVVSAAYNVSLYLDDFFKSLVDQRLDFTHNIHVVLVDDGSTDNSAEIIKKWQAKYPKNISYFYKENGGQASARNIGLKYVNTKWVTFVDPDDTLDLNFFLEIDKYIKSTKDKKLQMIVANLLMHDEKSGEIKNNHALKYRFEKNNVILPFDNLGKHINLSVSSSLFVTKVLQDHHIVFDKDIRPNFEDGHFIGQYLSSLTEGYVVFLNKAHYFYRKRSDNSSTIDTSWTQLGKYREVVERGYLGLFNIFLSKNELIPVHIQRTVLYDIIWHIKYLINRPERINFLTEEQRVKYLETFYEIFNYIDVKTIMEFELAGSWFLHKVGLLGLFKRSQPTFQIVYIDSYDLRKQQLLIRYFTYEKEFEYFTIGDEDIIPAHVKTMSYDFINQTFVLERRLWINISSDRKDELFNARISNLPTRINFNGKQFLNGISIYTILKHFGVKIGKSTLSIKYNDLWVLMDRDTQADDNAEHLYRYLREYEPQQSIVYVLRQDSADWTRLYDEGFNLVAYGSFEHEASLRACTKIISSHAEQHVVNYFKDNSLKDKQFIFLQHGVTKDDLSSWLNTKSIDCLVTSARAEFDSIIGDNTRYKFSDKEVVLTGFPRHDRLLQNLPEADRIILVMPTWRKNLVGEIVDGNIRSYNSQFMQSEYAQAWQSLLCDKNLQLLLENNNYQLVFYPHPNIQIYLSDFNLPAHIQVIETLNGSIQSLIRKSALLITDYSSVAYEMAYLKRPIIYYQFDDIFQGEHTYQKGYFDYERDGFGPVVHNKVAVLDALESIIKNNQRSKSIYLERMEKFFLFRDGQCCKRVAEAIFALDVPSSSEDVNLALLKQYAELASSVGEVHIAEKRWLRLLINENNENNSSERFSNLEINIFEKIIDDLNDRKKGIYDLDLNLLKARVYREAGKVEQAKFFIDNYKKENGMSLLWHLEYARLLSVMNQPTDALRFYEKVIDYYPELLNVEDKLIISKHYRILGNPWESAKILSQIKPTNLENEYNREWGEVCIQLKLWDKGEKYWRQLIAIYPEASERLILCLNSNHNYLAAQAVMLAHSKKSDMLINTKF